MFVLSDNSLCYSSLWTWKSPSRKTKAGFLLAFPLYFSSRLKKIRAIVDVIKSGLIA